MLTETIKESRRIQWL